MVIVAIVNGRMRSLKLRAAHRAAGQPDRCDSEWPYEVTETLTAAYFCVYIYGVAIVNGRMRSLKQYPMRTGGQQQLVAIVNGRMRSLKLLRRRVAGDSTSGCDSEWPYEVTETFHPDQYQRADCGVAIVNGRMRSLKPSLRGSNVPSLRVAIVNGRMRSLKHAPWFCPSFAAVVAIVNGRMRSLKHSPDSIRGEAFDRCDSEWPYEVTETWAAIAPRAPAGRCDSEWPYEVTETRNHLLRRIEPSPRLR